MRYITILGATGSIGISTLDVVARHPTEFEVFALTAHSQVKRLLQQCQQFRPRYAVIAPHHAAELSHQLQAASLPTEVLSGSEALEWVAGHEQVDDVMAAIVGAAGLPPCMAAARAGKRILLANKEALVMAGALFMDAVAQGGAELLPIDSEHNAIFQCMPTGYRHGLDACGVSRILLTASGGPFRTTSIEELAFVTPAQAVAHPNWSMGQKISVDSATMMNKGLEVIEAHWLFNATAEQIQVVIHPQSVIHSMVQYTDGSVLAELGNPDMRTPIAHCLGWPERIESGVAELNIFDIARLDFEPPDLIRFPCLRLAFEALQAGGSAPAILNAANEIAVDAFLAGTLRFTHIATVIEQVLSQSEVVALETMEQLLQIDRGARQQATLLLSKF